MEEAWQQIGKIMEENARLNRERFGREISNCLHKRIEAIEDGAELVEFATPADKVIAATPSTRGRARNTSSATMTLRTRLNNSTIPNTVSNRKSRKYFSRRKFTQQNKTNQPHPFETLKVNKIVDTKINIHKQSNQSRHKSS